ILTINDLKEKSAYAYSLWEALCRLSGQAIFELTADLPSEPTTALDLPKKYRLVFRKQVKWYTESVGFQMDDKSNNRLHDIAADLRISSPPSDLFSVLAGAKRHVLTLPKYRRETPTSA